jgi:hypothetical protein
LYAVPGLKLEDDADVAVAAAVLTPLAHSGDCEAMMEARPGIVRTSLWYIEYAEKLTL